LSLVFVASRSGLRRCVLLPGWCYRHQSDLAAMGKLNPVDSCGLTTCHNSPESTTTCCGGLWVNCGTLWRSCHNPPQNEHLVVVTCGDHNSLPTTRHNPPTTLLTTCHILPQLTHTLPHPTHNFSIIILQFDQFHSINTMITSANCVQFLYTVLVYVGGVDHSEKAGSWC